ncbi:hypothetical protein RCL1_001530 [Eukaryota sp. TZLM3-RCL]
MLARTPLFSTGVVTSAAGSVYVESGKTKLIATVIGPKQTRSPDFHSSAIINVAVSFNKYFQSDSPSPSSLQSKTSLIKSAVLSSLESTILLSEYPKTVIEIGIHVLEDDGSTFSLSVLAAYLACKDAQLKCKSPLVSSTVSFKGSEFLLDPKYDDEISADGLCVVSSLPLVNQIVSVEFLGKQNRKLVSRVVEFSCVANSKLIEKLQLNS